MSLIFEAAAKRADHKPIEFKLLGGPDGENDFHFTPPRSSVALALADTFADRIRVQLNWLEAGLPEEEAKIIHDRLFDPNDELEALDLIRIVNGLLEEISGRPTGPSPE